uniref:FecCD family ABC transporter permease n=1 Tax=Agathobacter sp. TaxID=2021311 RepID=UPI004055B27A
MKYKRYKWIMLGTGLFFIAAIFLSLCIGTARLSFSDMVNAVANGAEGSVEGRIFWYVRLPRTIACVLAGAALASSGTIIQSVLGNKLASPGIIGVNAGAGLAVTVCCAFGAISGWVIAGAAFGGAMFAVFLVAFTAQKIGASKSTVVLGGVAVNGFLNSVSEAITTLFPEAGAESADFRVGGFSSVTYARLLPAGILIGIALLFVLSFCNELDIMTLGEDTAQGLGLSVKKMRTLFLCLAALLAGTSVSFAGLLGFVGLVVPHLGRKIAGSESRKLLLFCILFGGGFVTVCDLASRTLFSPYEVPVGILMSFIGGPVFICILLSKHSNKGM